MKSRYAASAVAVLAMAFAIASFPLAADAAVFRAGGQVEIAAGDTLRDDLYVSGGKIEIDGVVLGDVVAFGGNIVMNGTVGGSMFSGAGSTTIAGSVGRTLRCGGGNMSVSGSVGDDVVAGGGRFVLARGARVGRDLLAGGGELDLEGDIRRNVIAGSGDLSIAGHVGGDVRARTGRTRLMDGANVEGDLVYSSDRKLSRSPGAVVSGKVEQRIPSGRRGFGPAGRVVGFFYRWERSLVGLLAIGMLLVLPFPAFSRKVLDALGGSPGPSLGVGVLLLFAVPFIAITIGLVGLLIGGWWVGMTVMVLFCTALAMGTAMTGAYLGARILQRPGQEVRLVWALVAGGAILTLFARVPILGICIGLIAAILGLGALAIAARRMRTAAA
jgi:cytoskeletal protein CcmA (bactofilin family)